MAKEQNVLEMLFKKIACKCGQNFQCSTPTDQWA